MKLEMISSRVRNSPMTIRVELQPWDIATVSEMGNVTAT